MSKLTDSIERLAIGIILFGGFLALETAVIVGDSSNLSFIIMSTGIILLGVSSLYQIFQKVI
jgi:hypothetical protein